VQPVGQTVIAGTAVRFQAMAVGVQPLNYQWRFKGSDIGGATLSSYTLAGAQAADAGVYSVQVTNIFGSAVSSDASLIVLVPPAITLQPSNQTAVVGTKPSFSVIATGTAPLVYQWAFDGTNLAGATDDTLLLTNVQPAQAGSYAVVITNGAGTITSTVANLIVLPFETLISLSVAQPTVSITFPSEVGFSYVLEYKDSLDDPTWTPLSPAVAGTDGEMVLQDPTPPADSRYYRVRRQ
jgi:hypothetical protein